ncbi:MAG: hypothetical protein WBD16_08045 [Pyrinomonadaceae bacterium]
MTKKSKLRHYLSSRQTWHAMQGLSGFGQSATRMNGGEIVATGTPEKIAKVENSFTGKYLAASLK